jgi:phage protein U
MSERKLRGGVNWQWALKQKRGKTNAKQWLGVHN